MTIPKPKTPRVPKPPIMIPPTPVPLLRVWVAGNPISSNHSYGARGYGAARRLTPEARAWREAVATSVMPWRIAESAPRPLLALQCTFVGGRADLDNMLKLLIDGVKLGLAVDDRFVVRLCAEKQSVPRGGEKGAWIEVTQLPQLVSRTRAKRTA